MRDVEEANAGWHVALMPAAEARPYAHHLKVSPDRRCGDVAHDNVLGAGELVGGERADDGRVRRVRDVDDPDASSAERLAATAAADVGVVAVGPDVAEIDITSQIRVPDGLEGVEQGGLLGLSSLWGGSDRRVESRVRIE